MTGFSFINQLLQEFQEALPALRQLPEVATSKDKDAIGVRDGLNATACSFYSSQGRLDDAFDDRNDQVIAQLVAKYPDVHTMEMETYHL